jgi:hypothetical protein
MPVTFEDAFARVKQLAEDFKANAKYYLSPQYQEAEARRDFIDKFLGLDERETSRLCREDSQSLTVPGVT